MPGSGAIISSDNVTQVTELARWGRGVITDIDLSADGQWIAVASGSGVYIHDAHDLSIEPRAIETTGNVTAVSISPAGDKVALVTREYALHLWQVEPLTQLFVADDVIQVQFSPDGSVLAITKGSVGDEFVSSGTLELWDSTDGAVLASYRPGYHLGPRIKFAPSSSRVAVWSQYDDTVHLYDWVENRLVDTRQAILHRESGLEEHQAMIGDLTFLNEDELRFLVVEILSATFVTGRIEIQEADDNALLFSLDRIDYFLAEESEYACNEPTYSADPPEPPVPFHMEASPDTQIVGLHYKGYGGDSVRFYQANGQPLYFIEEGIVDFEFSPDGQTWVAGLRDGRLQVRRLSDGAVQDSLDGYESSVLNVIVSPDNQWVGVVFADEIKVYYRETGNVFYRYPAVEIAFAPDSGTFILGYQDGGIELRNITDGTLINATAAHQDSVTAISYLPSGELLSAGFDCSLHRWQIPDMTLLGSLDNVIVEGQVSGEPVPVRVRDFYVMPDGQSVIGLLYSSDFGVWSIEDWRLIRTPNPDSHATILAIAPDGRYVAAPLYRVPESWDSSVKVVGIEADRVSFSPDGKLFAGTYRDYPQEASADGALKLWDVSSATLVHTLAPPTNSVTVVRFLGDGRLIASAGRDGIVRLWGIP